MAQEDIENTQEIPAQQLAQAQGVHIPPPADDFDAPPTFTESPEADPDVAGEDVVDVAEDKGHTFTPYEEVPETRPPVETAPMAPVHDLHAPADGAGSPPSDGDGRRSAPMWLAASGAFMALLCLLLLSGMLPVAFVGKNSVRPGAVDSTAVSDNSLGANDLNRSEVIKPGPRGPQGGTGPVGPKGTPGERGPAGSVEPLRYVRSTSRPATTTAAAAATCPADYQVSGGGAEITGSGAALQVSTRNGRSWRALAAAMPGAKRPRFAVVVTVACVKPKTDEPKKSTPKKPSGATKTTPRPGATEPAPRP